MGGSGVFSPGEKALAAAAVLTAPVEGFFFFFIFFYLHCDLWTLAIPSVSGCKYYLVVLDDFSHYLWTFPLRLKSDTFSTLSNFFAYVATQFGAAIQGIQCDNGR